jgi:small GTP-binding protein
VTVVLVKHRFYIILSLRNVFLPYYLVKKDPRQTISVEFSSKIIQVKDENVKLQLWDTAGQERYQAVTRSYYKGAFGVLILYDITRYESYQHIVSWIKDAKASAKNNCVIIIVGNKTDLNDNRQVPFNEVAKFCVDNSKF